MARHKWRHIPRAPVPAQAIAPPVAGPPAPTREDVHADLERMGRLPRPPRQHKRAQFRFRDSLKNYGCALFAILRTTHPGLNYIAKYRVACYGWRVLSCDAREAWAAPAARRY